MDPRLTPSSEYSRAGLSALKRFFGTVPEAVKEWPKQAWDMVRMPADLILGGTPEEQALSQARKGQAYQNILNNDFRSELSPLPAITKEGQYRPSSPEARAHQVVSFVNPLQNAVFAPKQALRALNSPLGQASLSTLGALALGVDVPQGALGMMGRRGAESRGLSIWKDILDAEFEAAAKNKRQGIDPRMKANSGHPLAHTGFDLKPRVEQDISDFLPKSTTPTDSPIPLADAFHLPGWFKKAYPDIVDTHKVHFNPYDPYGSGGYTANQGLIEIGLDQSHLSPVSRAGLAQYPQIVQNNLANIGAHELFGHAVARAEKQTPGTNPEKMAHILAKDPSQQIEKYLVNHSLYQDLADGLDPFSLYNEYLTRYPAQARDIKSAIQNWRSGALDKPSARDASLYAATQALSLQPKYESYLNLQRILNDKLMTLGPESLLEDAAAYAARKPGRTPESYALYRANAGENEADIIAERRPMSLLEKKEYPYLKSNEMPLEFLHGEN